LFTHLYVTVLAKEAVEWSLSCFGVQKRCGVKGKFRIRPLHSNSRSSELLNELQNSELLLSFKVVSFTVPRSSAIPSGFNISWGRDNELTYLNILYVLLIKHILKVCSLIFRIKNYFTFSLINNQIYFTKFIRLTNENIRILQVDVAPERL